MMAAAQALTDVETASLTNATTVGVLFKDGTSMILDMLPLNDSSNSTSVAGPPSAVQQLAEPRPSDATLPTNRTAFLYNAAPYAFSEIGLPSPPTNALQPWFQNAGYSTVMGTGQYTDFLNISNASVFVLNAHGNFGLTPAKYKATYNGIFGISTTVTPTQANVLGLLPYLQDGEMGYYAWSAFAVDPDTGKTKWYLYDSVFFTPLFVRNHMSFASNSLLFMNVCNLMYSDPSDPKSYSAQDMVNAFFEKGAGAILGWDNSAAAGEAVDSGWFFLDRVLGAGASPSGGYGSYRPKSFVAQPANRPFNAGAVYIEMQSKAHSFTPSYYQALGLTTTGPSNLNTTISPASWGSDSEGEVDPLISEPPIVAHLQLKFPPKGGPEVALVPTISTMTLQNNLNQLTLYGDFGGDYQSRSITIGGTPVDATWTSGSITVTSLPTTANGNVQVSIDGANSNQVLINQWNNVPLTMTTFNGDASRTVTCSVNLRTSFDTLRQAPDQAATTAAITTDNVVLQNGQCSFVSTDPAAAGDIPWFNSFAPGAPTVPATGVTVWSVGSTSDGNGGGTVELSIQAGYSGDQWSFLDTSATKGVGQNLVFDDSAEGLAAGLSTQYGAPGVVMDTLQWGATNAAWTPATKSQPQGAKPNPH